MRGIRYVPTIPYQVDLSLLAFNLQIFIISLSLNSPLPCLLSASPQGFASEKGARGLRDPNVALHGSLSVMVNFHALRLYAELARANSDGDGSGDGSSGGGGETNSVVFEMNPRDDGFKCCMLAMDVDSGVTTETGGAAAAAATGAAAAAAAAAAGRKRDAKARAQISANKIPRTRASFRRFAAAFDPESFSTFQRELRDIVAEPGAPCFLAFARLLPTYLPIYLPTYLSIHPSIYLSIYLSICLSIYLSIYLSIHLCDLSTSRLDSHHAFFPRHLTT